ncbi:MAG: fibronectin type III domain-containing protein, partial [Acidimicrobiia bacterium]|nr:fibronectin type III domain-containing protein [Acidimicrobiia bacterium]
MQDAFGGYCHVGRARHSAFGSGATRNPWRAGGCVPQAPPVTATTDTYVTWAAPRYDGGSPITKYLVEWKGPGEEFDPSRSLEITDLSSLSYPSEHLAPGSSVRVTAYNHNGWGEPFTFTTAAPVAIAAPVTTGAPAIIGTPQVGEELTADVSAIDDANGVPPASEFRFQWMVVDGGADIVIPGATSSTYYPSASQVGKAIKVR